MAENPLPSPAPTKQIVDDSHDFKWADDVIAVPEQQAVAAYWGANGHLVIRQERDWSRDEDAIILISPRNAQAFLDKLCNVLGIGSGP